MVYPDPAVLLEVQTRDQRTRQFVATLGLSPPDNNMTDRGGEPPPCILSHGPAEEGSVYAASEMLWGSSTDGNVGN
jgi:hypothetical protein